jgi:hypothetical protein
MRGAPALDCHGRILPEEGCHALSGRGSFGLPTLGESPRSHEIFHPDAFLDPVLDGVQKVWTCHLEESHEVVCWCSCLVLEAAFGRRNALLVGAVGFLASSS